MAEVIESSHQLFFQTAEPVSATLLAESLVGLDAIVRESARVLSRLLPDGPRISAEVLIQSIEAGSYKENFLIRLVFGEGKQQEKNIEKFRQQLGLKNMDAKKIVAMAIGLAIFYAGYQHFKPDDPGRIVIQNSFNSIGKDLGFTGEEIVAILDASLGNKKEQLKKEVVKLAAPVNQTLPGRLSLDNDPKLTVPAQVIERIPKEYQKIEPAEYLKDYTNEQVVIRALDLDNMSKGWAVSIPNLSSKRLPVDVDESIKAAFIPAGKFLYADITVLFREDKDGQSVPARVQIRKIRLNENDPPGTSL